MKDFEWIENADQKTTHMAYDAQGHVTLVRDANLEETVFTYDSQGGLKTIFDPEERLTQTLRDQYSRVHAFIDGKTKTTAFGYDNMDNLTSVTDHDGGVTTYQYAPGREGRLLAKVIDARQNTLGSGMGVAFKYDQFGRLERVTNAVGDAKTFAYDKQSNLIAVDDPVSPPITFDYDAMDRLDVKNLPEGPVDYAFDKNGNLTLVANYNGSRVEMGYDEVDRVKTVTQQLPDGSRYPITYAYDPNGNRTGMSTPWGNFAYAYDKLDRLETITNPEGKLITFTYDALNRRETMTYPNDTKTFYTYNKVSEVKSIVVKRVSTGETINSIAYDYDAAGNRTSMVDSTGTHAYGYDDLHRLISAEHPSGSNVPTKSEVFDYDRTGNRLFDANITAYQYDAANRLLSNSSFTYAYDNNGNQTGKTGKQNQGMTAYAYNAENQLVQADMPDGTRQTNAYDGLGRRIEKSTGPVGNMTAVRYVYDNEDILAMLDGNNNLIALFTHGPGIDEPNIMKEAGGPEYFFHADALGSIVGLTDSTGELVERIEYEAYGRPRFIDLRGGTPVAGDRSFTGSANAFTAREWDALGGIYFYRARHYNPRTGRFFGEDPKSKFAQAILRENEYSYIGGNPGRFIDPTGEDRVLVEEYLDDKHWVLFVGPDQKGNYRGFEFSFKRGGCDLCTKWKIARGKSVPGEYMQRTENERFFYFELPVLKQLFARKIGTKKQTLAEDELLIKRLERLWKEKNKNNPEYNAWDNNCQQVIGPYFYED